MTFALSFRSGGVCLGAFVHCLDKCQDMLLQYFLDSKLKTLLWGRESIPAPGKDACVLLYGWGVALWVIGQFPVQILNSCVTIGFLRKVLSPPKKKILPPLYG